MEYMADEHARTRRKMNMLMDVYGCFSSLQHRREASQLAMLYHTDIYDGTIMCAA